MMDKLSIARLLTRAALFAACGCHAFGWIAARVLLSFVADFE
jgi:hypothetical protein